MANDIQKFDFAGGNIIAAAAAGFVTQEIKKCEDQEGKMKDFSEKRKDFSEKRKEAVAAADRTVHKLEVFAASVSLTALAAVIFFSLSGKVAAEEQLTTVVPSAPNSTLAVEKESQVAQPMSPKLQIP